ncbi:MAG: glycosyltransferase family 4 protein [Myxococcaceae bacterium]|nr:glycosyltransferase family 4 protein [Myxococcaceae bacterium]
MRVHQLLPVFSPHDAMSQAAISFQWLLRRLGHFGHVHAAEVAPGYASLVRSASQLKPARDDLVLYHHGIASELSSALLHLPCRRGVVFHNITPARFYAGTQLEEALTAGRAQLAALAGRVDVSIGVSHFNAAELRVAGHTNVHTVPLFVEPNRFDRDAADEVYLRELKYPGTPLVVSVSRVVPHKRVEDLLRLHAELARKSPGARLLVIGPYAQGSRYFRDLPKPPGVTFAGAVSHAELVAAYRAADVFVSMSEHEGFGVPLVEAMACDVPVLAFAAAAVPETLDGRGIAFDEKNFAVLAELVLTLRDDHALRARIIEGQHERVEALSPAASQHALAEALDLPRPAARRRRAKKTSKPKLAIVVQRYGEQIVGGAEAHARQVAWHLADRCDVTVLTTCASDHLTWADTLPEGEARDGRVTVHRFACGGARKMRPFNRLSDERFDGAQSRTLEEHWLMEQGPRAPGLLEHLADTCGRYDAYVFFTYLYAPTALGLPLVAERALLVPTAHDEPALKFDLYADTFELPRALLCNTPEEAALIAQRFPQAARSRIVGVGVDPLPDEGFRPVPEPYLLYVGRLEAGKGLKELVKHHGRELPTLVLAGAGDLDLPARTNVKRVGRITEQQKYDALRHAAAVVVPSKYESLSLLALEAFACGAPVIGNAESNVVAGHLTRSGAGVAFSSFEGYAAAVREVLAEREKHSQKALGYAKRFRWPKVVEAYLAEIEKVRRAT